MADDDQMKEAAKAAEAHQERQDRARGSDNPRWCSGCGNTPDDNKAGFILEERRDPGKMLFCSLRCIAVWAMQRGWRK